MTKSYGVDRSINAPTEVVWSLLTNAAAYPEWNPSVISIDGDIRDGSSISLIAAIDPKRAFDLRVAIAEAPTPATNRGRMTWQDGMPLNLFKGVRTFEIDAMADGSTRFSMTEVFSGPLAPVITRFIPDLTEAFDQFADGLQQAAETP